MSDESDNSEDDSVSESSESSELSEKVTYMQKLSEILESFDVRHTYFSNVDLLRVNTYSTYSHRIDMQCKLYQIMILTHIMR